MLKAITLLSYILALVLEIEASDAIPACVVRVNKDISLEEQGVLPHEADFLGHTFPGVSTNIDLYSCGSPSDTLVIMVSSVILEVFGSPGTPAGKEVFSLFATDLAEAGYTVAVVEKIVPAMNMSAVTSVDVLRVIEYIDSGASPLGSFYISDVVVGGHGFGGAMVGYLLSHSCPGTFCSEEGPTVGTFPLDYQFVDSDLETFSKITAGFWFGGVAFVRMPAREPGGDIIFAHTPNMTGDSGVPFLMIYGSGEENILGSDMRALISFNQWESEKAMVVLQGLDHDGMSDLPVASAENTIPTTIPAEVRAAMVADTLDLWIQRVQHDTHPDDSDYYCKELKSVLGPGNVTGCVFVPDEADFDDNGYDNSDDWSLGEHVGCLIGVAMTTMMAIMLV